MNPIRIAHPKWRHEAALDFYNLFLGLFLFVSPWLFAIAGGEVRNEIWASGALIALVSLAAIVAFAEWEEWLTLALGLWLVVSPWVLGFAHTRAMHVSIAVGAIVAFVAAIEIWLIHEARTSRL